jgi:predicted butyrate kinase (DUF1464 family)
MPRVIGIDPGTFSVDLCGLDNGRPWMEQSLPTSVAFSDPARLITLLEGFAPLDAVVGPSGYGLPLTRVAALSEADIRMACLAPRGELAGVAGLGSLLRALSRLTLPVFVTPGVIHLPSVPAHRKANRVDMGTADKVCAVVLGIHERVERRRCRPEDVSFTLLELGGAFTAALAVEEGRIVDGLGGSSGALGPLGAGALDGEVAYLAGEVTKQVVFTGGALSMLEAREESIEALADQVAAESSAWAAYAESAVKAVAALAVSAPAAREVVLSGRVARMPRPRADIARRLRALDDGLTVSSLHGFSKVVKQGAQGAALLADGLTGGAAAGVVERLGIREASGTAFDHLFVIPPARARARLGI